MTDLPTNAFTICFSKLVELAPDDDTRALNINATCMALLIRSKRCIKGMKSAQ